MVELITSQVIGSLALFADGMHNLADVFSVIIGIVAEHVSVIGLVVAILDSV